MAEEPADAGTRAEGTPTPSEHHGRSDRQGGRGGGGPAGDEREGRSGGGTGRSPGDESRGRDVDEHDRQSGDDRGRRSDDRHDRERRFDGRYERDRWDDDGHGHERRSDERDRWDDDGHGHDPRPKDARVFEDAYPGMPAGPFARRGFRRFRLTAWIALVVAAVVVGVSITWVNGPPTEAELREKAGLLSKDRLRIGVKDDTPGIALRSKDGSGFEGFDIDIAYLIAADLGFRRDQVEFMSIETEDRARMQARNGNGEFVRVDLVVATFSVTPARKADPSVGFSTPYLFTEQSVVTRSDYQDEHVASLGQLEGRKVCSLGTSTSLTELSKAIRGNPIAEGLISKCVERLRRGDIDAVTTDAALLAGFVTQDRNLRHHDIALEKTEMWAVNAGPNAALRTLVDLALYRSYADPQNQRWEEAYKAHIEPLLKTNPGVNVAQAEQPCALPPPVRRWPWERTLPARDCPSAP
ncbi:transporter substrate-binding domain-containing protein [Streptosporangium sp. NBC_01755]|uniref:transporter substrate-binding domain-containing protein n=1 Tax=Streptosporangium sp. NBC_01755 TaxID=2975949 RepID=UPI002DD7C7CB|nr:transporter substrate-binding domain-containing protein [Streptosporangium sp. NBC_01755]WSC98493.1 transporter substrate-binding domain-containing protein [Streptosporangium sp. NBC_01755]